MTRMLHLVAMLLFLFIGETLIAQCDCEEIGNCPVPITDNGSFQGSFDVTVQGPNDLGACPLISVCFSIDHTWVGDLAASLTSPSGQNYLIMADSDNTFGGCGTNADNIDICIVPGTSNPLTNNTDYVCNGGNPCLTGTWTMPCGGVVDAFTGAQQAPSCDLNDFNVGGAPANGTWTLTVNDICGADVGFLNNFTLTFACPSSCDECAPEGGVLNADDMTSCFNDPSLFLDLPPNYPNGNDPDPGEYGYAYVITQNGIITEVNPSADMSIQPPGTYQVCGLSYQSVAIGNIQSLIGMDLATAQSLLSSVSPPFCGDLSDDCIQVVIGPPVLPTILDTMVCLGDCIDLGSQTLCSDGSVFLESWLGCDSEVIVVMLPIFVPPTIFDTTVCQGECITIDGDLICPPGGFDIVLESWQGCDSIISIILLEEPTEAIISPNPPPLLDCTISEVVLDGLSSVPSSALYEWSGPSGPMGDSPIIQATEVGEYILTITNLDVFPPCTSTTSVFVESDQTGPQLEYIDPEPNICQGESFDLTSLDIFDLNGTGPDLTYHSGTPATLLNQIPVPFVTPTATTTYYILGTSGACTDEISVTIFVNPAPPPTMIDTMVCSGSCVEAGGMEFCQSGQITIPSFAGCDSVITVNLTPVVIDPTVETFTVCEGECITVGTEMYCPPGPYIITYQTAQGCDSLVTYILLEETTTAVINPGGPVALDCTNPNAVLDASASTPLAGATIAWSGPSGPLGSDVAITVNEPGTYTLTITNSASSPPCTSTASVEVTSSQTGPDLQLNSAPPSICQGQTFDLASLNISDANSTGPTLTYHSGTPATPANELPSTVVSPTATTTYYVLGTVGLCTDELPVTITVNPVPTADFTVETPICLDENSTITYTGSASSGAVFNWNFGGGTATPGTGLGPHAVSWATAGPKTITLTVEENGCTSEAVSQTVEVAAPLADPVINCTPTQTSILFTWGDVANATDYSVTVLTGQTNTSMPSATSFEVTGLAPGETVTILVEAVSGNACGNSSAELTCTAQNCPMVDVTIDPVANICLDASATAIQLVASQTGGLGGGTFTFAGNGVDPATGIFDPNAAELGDNTIQVNYAEGTCTYNGSTIITINPQPTADFTATSPICEDNSSTVNYTGTASSGAIFTWDFAGGTATPGTGPGPHTVVWPQAGNYTLSLEVEENDCSSEMNTEAVQVDALIPEPAVNCMTTTSSIEFFWDDVPGADGYDVAVITGSGGTMTSDTSMLFTGLTPNTVITIEITANGTTACGPTTVQATCEAQDCPTVNIDIDPVADICLDASAAPFDLAFDIMGGMGNGSIVVSGTGIVSTSGTFDPAAANLGDNAITVTYTEGNCVFTENTTITIFETPVASFTAASPICETNASTVTFDGTAISGAIFTWDFAGGTATPGTGPGPHTVVWPQAGNYTISLNVEQNGCTSETASQNVQVDEALLPPNISCSSTTSSIEFSWPDVAGATGYDVTVLSGATGTLDATANTYTIIGLNPNDEVTIELTVNSGGACPDVVIEETCTAIDCPSVQVEIDSVDAICLGNSTLFQLAATPMGGTWSGPGITDPVLGTFDPQTAGTGNHQITYELVNGNCSYDGSIFIEIFDEPNAEFSASPNVCIMDEATVEYTGNAAASAVYTWDFAGGTATPGTGPGPHTVVWPQAGNYTISLNVEQDGCASQTETQNVQVDEALLPPNISCSSTTSSIEFSWPAVAGATAYDVTVLSGATGILDLTANTYTITGLNPNDEVTIQLTVSGGGACPDVMVEETCVAVDCPSVLIDIESVPAICLGNSAPIQLSATPMGGTWSGPGITDPVLGTFDPQVAGTGNHPIVYELVNGNCSYNGSIFIVVFGEPSAEFSASPNICVTDEAIVEYTGNASANAVYTWDFAGGTATPGTGLGPHTVVWPQAGNYTISLSVEQDGCASQTETQNVQVDDEIAAPGLTCTVSTSWIAFNWNDVSGGANYEVTVLSGASGVQGGNTYLVEGLMPGDEVCIELTVSGNTACGPVSVQACCTANDCPPVSLSLEPIGPFCLDATAPATPLEALATGGSGTGSGTWSGPGVDSGAATFDATAAGVGTHLLTYIYEENADCSYSENMTVEVVAPPVADAGMDAELTCEEDEMDTTLGGESSTGQNIAYSWSFENGYFGGDSTSLNPVVSAAGTYILTVTNTALGCTATDEVVVSTSQAVPEIDLSIVPISCFGEDDGILSITGVTGGEGPYMYSLNGAPFGSDSFFQNLEPGEYNIAVLDVNGCENDLTIDISQPQEVDVELVVLIDGTNNIIQLGDAVDMVAMTGIPEDSLETIQWQPANLVDCDSCLYVTAEPTQQTTFSVTIEDNGCADSDQVNIFVERDHLVYVPNAFSPNGDNINEYFMIYGREDIVNIKSFLVFSRWGETVFQYYNFPPNQPAYGWDGTHRGRELNPAVFTWFAEVEFADGTVKFLEGDVTLTR